MSKIAIIGAGAWGTGLSIALGRQGAHEVSLWALEAEVRESITEHHENQLFLPGYRIPNSVTATNDVAEALAGSEIVVSVMPSHHCRALFQEMHQHLQPEMLLVSATKGLENDTLLRMTEVMSEVVRETRK